MPVIFGKIVNIVFITKYILQFNNEFFQSTINTKYRFSDAINSRVNIFMLTKMLKRQTC